MLVANMNLHEAYASLMADKKKLEWKRDAQREAIFEECLKDVDNLRV